MNPSEIDHLVICKTCKRRDFDLKKGLICSVTNDKRCFIGDECIDYQQDTIVANDTAYFKKKKQKQEQYSLFVSIVSILTSFFLYWIGMINLISIFLFIIGFSLIIHHLINRQKSRKALGLSDDQILDR